MRRALWGRVLAPSAGRRLKAIPDIDRFIAQAADLAAGRFDGEPAGIEALTPPDDPLPAVETLVLVTAPLISNFFDSPQGGREGIFQGASAPALAHFVGAHPKERYMQATGLYDFRAAPLGWLAASRRAERDAREREGVDAARGASVRAHEVGAMEGALRALSHSSFNAMATDLLAAAAAADELALMPRAGAGRAERERARCVVGRQLLRLTGDGFESALRAPSVHGFAARVNAARGWLALAAGLSGAMAVDVSAPCAQPWVPRRRGAHHGVDQALQPAPETLSRERLATHAHARFTHLLVAAVPFAGACDEVGSRAGADANSTGAELGAASAAAQPAPTGCCSFVWDVSTLKDSNLCTPTSHIFYHCAYALSPVRVRATCANASRATLVLAGDSASAQLGWVRAVGGSGGAPASAGSEPALIAGSIDGSRLVAAVRRSGVQIVSLLLPRGYALPALRGVRRAELDAAIANATGVARGMDSCGGYCRLSLARKGVCEALGPSRNCSAALLSLAREAGLVIESSR